MKEPRTGAHSVSNDHARHHLDLGATDETFVAHIRIARGGATRAPLRRTSATAPTRRCRHARLPLPPTPTFEQDAQHRSRWTGCVYSVYGAASPTCLRVKNDVRQARSNNASVDNMSSRQRKPTRVHVAIPRTTPRWQARISPRRSTLRAGVLYKELHAPRTKDGSASPRAPLKASVSRWAPRLGH